jgi:hypothetical protein
MRRGRLTQSYQSFNSPHAAFRLLAAILSATAAALSMFLGLQSPAQAAAATPERGKTSVWQREIAQRRTPGVGCFTAVYPSLKWRHFACQTPPKNAPPQVLVAGHHPPQVVGAGTDYLAEADGTTRVTGSFFSISNPTAPAGPTETSNGTSNSYSLQLNPNRFSSSLCSTLPVPSSCVATQQFVYSHGSNAIYIQYWLLDPNLTSTSLCPNSSYHLYIAPNGNTLSGCWVNSSYGYLAQVSPPISAPPVAHLANVQLTGSVVAGGNDTLKMTVSGQSVSVSTPDLAPAGGPAGSTGGVGLAGNWDKSEFAIVGDGNSSQAVFNSGTTMQVLMSTDASSGPTCVYGGFTAETNNLNLAAPPALGGTASSGVLESTQTYGAPETPSCANGTTWGETHLITLSNDPRATSDLTYNFQSSGDYTLARTSNFEVQSQQILDPTQAALAINQEIGAQIGSSDVAVCTNPTRLFVNGSVVSLANGVPLNLPDGVVSLNGTTYLIQDDSGDFVTASLYQGAGNIDWMDANVGIGSWPTAVSGLLANARNNVDQIESRSGTVLTAPFAFNEFYGDFATSWVVPANRSLMSACGRKVVARNPTINFYANDLTSSQYDAGRAVCVAAGVAISVIDSCILDAATLGEKEATSIYARLPRDITWGAIAQRKGPSPPGAPTHVTAVVRSGFATVSFEPPTSNGGNAISGYTVTAADMTSPQNGGETSSRASGHITLHGLVIGDRYTFSVTATNSVGTSKPSRPSSPVAPGGAP